MMVYRVAFFVELAAVERGTGVLPAETSSNEIALSVCVSVLAVVWSVSVALNDVLSEGAVMVDVE